MSLPANQLFQILSPAREESRYRYRIRQAGLDFNAYLTYEVPQVSDERSILLVNVSYAFIDDEHRVEYSRFIERIRESSGRFTGMKNIVNRLVDGEFAKLPNVRVAVHKYGPVPVYVLPEKYVSSAASMWGSGLCSVAIWRTSARGCSISNAT